MRFDQTEFAAFDCCIPVRRRATEDYNDASLGGQVDMVGVNNEILADVARRRRENRVDAEIPVCPDHGPEILSDLTVDLHPGNPDVERLKGLAEIHSVVAALSREAVQ